MAVPVSRGRPYLNFNFLVDLGMGNAGGTDTSFQAGFQECSVIGTEVTVAEYRNGNARYNNVMKITGINKSQDLTLKRGCGASVHLYKWLDQIRTGDQLARRTVTIHLQSEDHKSVMSWKLKEARPTKINFGSFNAKGTDVLMEELVLAYEQLELDL